MKKTGCEMQPVFFLCLLGDRIEWAWSDRQIESRLGKGRSVTYTMSFDTCSAKAIGSSMGNPSTRRAWL